MRPAHIYATLTPAQHRDLVTALHGSRRVTARIVMVLLSSSGMTATEIARLPHYDPVTVRRWIARHARDGLAGLPDRPRGGRPRLGSPRLGQRIRTLLTTPKAWTTARLWRAAGRPPMSLATFRRRIREQARWCRPRLIATGDPDHDTICADIRERITALPAGSVVLAEDETHIDLLPRVRACWMPTGLRHRIPTPGSNRRRTVHGAIDLATGAFHHQRLGQERLRGVLPLPRPAAHRPPRRPGRRRRLRQRRHPPQRHHPTMARQAPRLMLIQGAKYSPQDNPVERVWAGLEHWIANTAPATMADRVRQTHTYFRNRTDEQMLTTAAPWTSPWLPEGYGQHF
jgi:hypothetical protein